VQFHTENGGTESQYYLQTLQGAEADNLGPQTLSVNRFDGKMPIPIPMPEQDYDYESEKNWTQRRTSNKKSSPPKNHGKGRLEPIKIRQTDFLRRGNGNGGSPTTHTVGKMRNNDSGMITLSPIRRK